MRSVFPILSAGLVLSALLTPAAFAAPKDQTLTAHIFSTNGEERSSFSVPSANAAGGASLAVGDLGKDGVPEIVIGMGMGNEPRVRVYRQNGTEISSFLAYDKGFGFGINVAVCDVNGDGTNEIITTAQRGGGPHVRVFAGDGSSVGPGFMAYDPADRSGLNLACGDLDADGAAEVVTLPSPGAEPRVKAWKWSVVTPGMLELWNETLVGAPASQDGLVGFIQNGVLHATTMRGTPRLRYGITFATEPAAVSLPTEIAQPLSDRFSATADLDGDGSFETVSIPARPWFGATKPDAEKSIVVDVSEQRLYAYEYGILTNTFLVSTARKGYRTPPGDHTVTDKVEFVHYKGGSGDNAYDLGVVQYNLRFKPRYYIHYAPWHNNFGFPMSRGCVNVNLPNMKWIYGWSDAGTPISVRE